MYTGEEPNREVVVMRKVTFRMDKRDCVEFRNKIKGLKLGAKTKAEAQVYKRILDAIEEAMLQKDPLDIHRCIG